MENLLIWLGILFCITQSAIFSGLNLAFFSLTKLRLEIEVDASGNKNALRVLNMRKDSNFLLTTILWGNVGINVLLTLLSNSVLIGIYSFLFSTVVITFFGELMPQAYFSRNALKMASLLSPVIKVYQIILYPIAKPCAILLDRWLGKESYQFFPEENIKILIQKHIDSTKSDIDKIEGIGAINFLTIDDIKASEEGEIINNSSIIQLDSINSSIIFPPFEYTKDDPFIQQINLSEKKWVVFTNDKNIPKLVLDCDGFIRSVLFDKSRKNIKHFSHKPIVIRDEDLNLGELILELKKREKQKIDLPIKKDIALVWTDNNKRIITGADLFGKLLKGM